MKLSRLYENLKFLNFSTVTRKRYVLNYNYKESFNENNFTLVHLILIRHLVTANSLKKTLNFITCITVCLMTKYSYTERKVFDIKLFLNLNLLLVTRIQQAKPEDISDPQLQ